MLIETAYNNYNRYSIDLKTNMHLNIATFAKKTIEENG